MVPAVEHRRAARAVPRDAFGLSDEALATRRAVGQANGTEVALERDARAPVADRWGRRRELAGWGGCAPRRRQSAVGGQDGRRRGSPTTRTYGRFRIEREDPGKQKMGRCSTRSGERRSRIIDPTGLAHRWKSLPPRLPSRRARSTNRRAGSAHLGRMAGRKDRARVRGSTWTTIAGRARQPSSWSPDPRHPGSSDGTPTIIPTNRSAEKGGARAQSRSKTSATGSSSSGCKALRIVSSPRSVRSGSSSSG